MNLRSNLAINKNHLNNRVKSQLKNGHLGRVYSSRPHINLSFYIVSILASSVFFSTYIFNLVKSNELTAKISETKKQLKIQLSEQIRLRTELEQNINLKSIEQYAKKKLHMKKFDKDQIIYIRTPVEDNLQINSDKLNEKPGFFKMISQYVLKFLSNF